MKLFVDWPNFPRIYPIELMGVYTDLRSAIKFDIYEGCDI